MRLQDIKKLKNTYQHFKRGGLPDLGAPHPKAGFRYAVGLARYESGRIGIWRENLGWDELLAQYRARAMVEYWVGHCNLTGGFDAETPLPVKRAEAQREAWEAADAQMRRPFEVAAEWNANEASGRVPYSPGFKLLAVRTSLPDEQAGAVAVVEECPVAQEAPPLTLHRAADQWVIHLLQRFQEEDVSDSYVNRVMKGTVKRLKELAKDDDIAAIAKPHLDAIRLAFQRKRKKSGALRRRGTIDTELGHVRSLFRWLVDSELWNPCRDWERWLTPIHRSDENDDDADREKTVDTYEIDELARIYAAGQPCCCLWILCGLNFNWGAKETSTARKRHFKRESADRRVARFRHKRKPGTPPVPGRWSAWPETWKMALSRMDRTTDDPVLNPKGRAFLTRDGNELVRYTSRRNDVIADAFDEACKKAGVKNKGFYAIRRTAIDLIDQIAGERTADLFSQHAPKTMTKKFYTNRRWKRLFRALRILRRRLQPMFDAAMSQQQVGVHS